MGHLYICIYVHINIHENQIQLTNIVAVKTASLLWVLRAQVVELALANVPEDWRWSLERERMWGGDMLWDLWQMSCSLHTYITYVHVCMCIYIMCKVTQSKAMQSNASQCNLCIHVFVYIYIYTVDVHISPWPLWQMDRAPYRIQVGHPTGVRSFQRSWWHRRVEKQVVNDG